MKGCERRKEKQEIKQAQKIKQAERKTKRQIVRFFLIFLSLFVIISFLSPFISPYFEPAIITVSSWTAGLVGFILSIFRINAHTSGPTLALNNLSIKVVSECIGTFEILIFFAAILAFPVNYKKKLLGLIFCIPALYLLNLFRMILICVIGNWNPKTFDFLHLYFWQVAGILIIGGMWLFWIEKVVKYER